MAIDEAILTCVSAGNAPPTLRLYGWAPPCLSLGYGQRASEVDTARLATFGWEMVRRPTGGRAILHADELTYSLAVPQDHPLARSGVVESYRRISEALLAALQALGAHPQSDLAQPDTDSISSPVCFETPSHYEITVGGKKLVGSAQVRRRQGMLQHGTLPLCGDIARICDVLHYPDEQARAAARADVHRRATTLADALGSLVDWRTAADAVAAGFMEAFGIAFVEAKLSPQDVALAHRLSAEVYGNLEWTFRR